VPPHFALPSPPPPARARRRVLSFCLAAVALAGTAGCSGSTTSSVPSSATSTSTARLGTSAASASTAPNTTTGTTPRWTIGQQGVIDAYLAARSAFTTSLAHPDPDDPALAATHVDPLLSEVRKTNAEWRGFGQAGRFPDNSVSRTDITDVSINGSTATVDTCGVDDSIVYEVASGKVLNSDVVTVQAHATMTAIDGTWKLASRSEVQRWEGVAGCAVGSPS
jgi:hypothetical protein